MPDDAELHVLRTLLHWRQQQLPAVLATVLSTWGSAPRAVGALMALNARGEVAGSVSGGCIEDALRARVLPTLRAPSEPRITPERLQYGITSEEARSLGLPCGGTLELLLEFNPDTAPLATLVEGIARGALMHKRVDLHTGALTCTPTTTVVPLACDTQAMHCTLGPAWRMLLIGAGDIATYLAAMARFNGFQVTVCDPRPGLLALMDDPSLNTTAAMPDDAVHTFAPDARSCVITLSHDPKLDDVALIGALTSAAFYVGAIGSQTNAAKRRARLQQYGGVSPEAIASLHGPAGLAIGSKTPPEIAVSIMAQVLAVRHHAIKPSHTNHTPSACTRHTIVDALSPTATPHHVAPPQPCHIPATIAVEVDATGMECPIPILKARQALQTVEAGQLVRVQASDPAAAQDFPRYATQSGHTLIAQDYAEGRYAFVLRKRAHTPVP